MKKLLTIAAGTIVLVSCSGDKITGPTSPANPGSEVNFSLQFTGNNMSRTIYGDEANNSFPIYWVNGDEVLIASPGATIENARYTIEAGENQDYATSMTKIGDAGIQWGSTFPQNFYSIYPVGYTTQNNTAVENTLYNNSGVAVAHLNVRDNQIVRFAKTVTADGTVWKGTPIDHLGKQNPDALMYAQKQMTEDGAVTLRYIPFTTAFHIDLAGYDLTDQLGEDPTVTIEEVIVEAPAGVTLVGDFTATFDANCVDAPTVDVSGNTTRNSNIIRVQTMDSEYRYLTINKGEKVSFNVFAIPVGNEVSSDWKLTVRTLTGTYTRPLTPGQGTDAGKLIAGMVHKLNMPAFMVNSDFTFDKTSWMSQIPRNVYITNLSLPGAWYSRQSEYQGTNNGTTWTLQALWDAGVRAFSCETRTATARWGSTTPTKVVVSGTGVNGGMLSDAYYYGGDDISGVMGDLADAVSESGYAVLVLSYADGGEGGHRSRDYAFWLQGIYNSYNSLSAARKAKIYQGPLTSETTVGDVLGKLILQVNVASGLVGGDITIGDYAGNLPGLLTYVNRKRESGTAPISQMHWSEWNDSYMVNKITSLPSQDLADVTNALMGLDPNTLYCNYTIANRTQLDTGTATDLPTYANRKQAISRILRNSEIVLNNGRHNIWSMIGAGGTQATSSSSSTSAQSFAANMNAWLLEQLETRMNNGNYAPLGLVLCNYIANTVNGVDGNEIIDHIVRMNQMFRLSRDENKPEWPDSGQTVSKSQADYSSSLSKDPNGWDAF